MKPFKDVRHFDNVLHSIRGWGIKLSMGTTPLTRKSVKEYISNGSVVHYQIFEAIKVMQIHVDTSTDRRYVG